MSTDRIISRLDELLNTLGDAKSAYVVRSRLDRVLLMTRRQLDQTCPADSHRLELYRAMSRIEDSFRALRRRSEPFGDGWLRNLEAARGDLLDLRAKLLSHSHTDAP